MMEAYFSKKKLNNKSRDKTIISGEIWSSHLEFWKAAILKKFGKFHKNRLWQSIRRNVVDTQTAILT